MSAAPNDASGIHYTTNAGTLITGPDGMAFVRAVHLASFLKLYAKSGIRPTRHVTPRMMMQQASELTGKKFKARDYLGASEAVSVWVQTMKAALPKTLDGEPIA